ncbi:uncharacterized protein AB9X84_014851 [Acanthopagrus schlegelii]
MRGGGEVAAVSQLEKLCVRLTFDKTSQKKQKKTSRVREVVMTMPMIKVYLLIWAVGATEVFAMGDSHDHQPSDDEDIYEGSGGDDTWTPENSPTSSSEAALWRTGPSLWLVLTSGFFRVGAHL